MRGDNDLNKYLKALILTVILLALGIAVTRYIDNSRINSVSSGLEEASLDAQSTEQLLLYDSIFNDPKETCAVLPRTIDAEVSRTGRVLADLEAAQAQGLFQDYGLVKRKYLNQNIELYLYVEKYMRDCNDSLGMKPVLFFYPDKEYCADCTSQGKVLDSMHGTCPGMRVFAVPADLGIPVVDIFKAKYGISSLPSMVISNKVFTGLYPSDSKTLRQALSCQ